MEEAGTSPGSDSEEVSEGKPEAQRLNKSGNRRGMTAETKANLKQNKQEGDGSGTEGNTSAAEGDEEGGSDAGLASGSSDVGRGSETQIERNAKARLRAMQHVIGQADESKDRTGMQKAMRGWFKESPSAFLAALAKLEVQWLENQNRSVPSGGGDDSATLPVSQREQDLDALIEKMLAEARGQ